MKTLRQQIAFIRQNLRIPPAGIPVKTPQIEKWDRKYPRLTPTTTTT